MLRQTSVRQNDIPLLYTPDEMTKFTFPIGYHSIWSTACDSPPPSAHQPGAQTVSVCFESEECQLTWLTQLYGLDLRGALRREGTLRGIQVDHRNSLDQLKASSWAKDSLQCRMSNALQW